MDQLFANPPFLDPPDLSLVDPALFPEWSYLNDERTLLVVEHNPLSRATAVSMFEALGFTVFDAYNGHHALALLEASPRDQPALSRMPGMSGPELAALVRQRRPDIKLVLTSGYVGKEAVPSGLDFVVKAWRVDQVTRVVGTPGLNPVESCHPRGAGTSARSGAGRREIRALEAGPPGWGGVMRRRPNAGLA